MTPVGLHEKALILLWRLQRGFTFWCQLKGENMLPLQPKNKQTKKHILFFPKIPWLVWSFNQCIFNNTFLMVLPHCCSELKCRSQGPVLIFVIACYTTSGVNDWENTKINWFLECCFKASHNNVKISATILYWLYTYCYHWYCILHSLSTWRKRPEKIRPFQLKSQFYIPLAVCHPKSCWVG